MNAYVINLDSREDRLKLFKENDFPFPVERFPAITASCGENGCTYSHLAVLKNVFPFVVFEDDAVLIEKWKFVEKSLTQLPSNWDGLWLGATLRQPLVKYSLNLFQLKKAWCLHAVIYNSPRMIEYILENHNTPSGINLDTFYCHEVFKRFNCFLTYPLVAVQSSGLSDISKKYQDHFTEILTKYNHYVK